MGYVFNLEFTDEKAACLSLPKSIYAMLWVEESFQALTQRPVSDAAKFSKVLLVLSANIREKVDEHVQQVLVAGGNMANEPIDFGWMFVRFFRS